MTWSQATRSHGPARHKRASSALHGPLAIFLVIVVALSVVPLGSNRPFYWAFWAAVMGAASLCYAVTLLVGRSDYRVSIGSIRSIAIPYLLICLVLVVQLAPLGRTYWGDGIATLNGARVVPPFISAAPGETVLMLLRWFSYGMMFFLTLQAVSNDRRRLRLLQFLSCAISAHAILGILQFYQWGNTILGFPKWAYMDSISGTFVNRNSFATLLAVGLTMTVGLILHTLQTRRGQQSLINVAFYGICMIFLIGALLGSNSRMGVLVGIVGPLVTTGSFMIATGGTRRSLWIILPALAAIGVAASFYGSGTLTRFFELEASGRDRGELYSQVWEMIRAAPFLGYGGGSFAQVYQVFHQPPVNVELIWDRAHNTYFALWSELGFGPGLLPLLLVAAVTIRAARATRAMRGRDVVDPALPIWLGVSAIAALHSLVDFSFEMFANALVFSMLAAAATAASLSVGRPRHGGRDGLASAS